MEEKTLVSILESHEPLIKSTIYRITKNFNKTRHVNQFDDFLSIAKMATIKAIKSYDSNKKAKLSTYIVRCIEHKLYDIDRSTQTQKTPEVYYYDEAYDDSIYMSSIQPSTYLEEKEIGFLEEIAKGKTIAQIVSEYSSKKKISKRRSSDEVCKCFSDIQAKLTYKEANLVMKHILLEA